MLKYFVDTTEALITAAVISGLVMGYAKASNGKKGGVTVLIGIICGIIGAGIMAYMKNATKKIDTSLWNLRNFSVSLVSLVIFFIFVIISAVLKKNKPKAADIISYSSCILLSLITASALFYSLPDIFTYPYSILLVEKSVLSTTFILKFIGILLGIIFVFLMGLALNRGSERTGRNIALAVMSMALCINAARQLSVCLRVMLTKRMIEKTDLLFEIAKFSSNNERLFIYGGLAAGFVVPVVLLIKSLNVREPYSNPAEHRKIRRKWIISKHWAAFASVCIAFSLVDITAMKAAANKVVELSPVEDAQVVGDSVYVTFEQVADGHLHRFGYTTDNGVQIRFIVIKKPNSSSYGIGLDACDICGETGYYEKDGQVVCKLCDVVMNINTIGFKGGCNPIVISYTIDNGNIIVPIEGLLEYEHEFKN
ncbi:MAG: DUF2318 domain-containing protein [Ruminococcus sp.]|nr:DUF2318 domain-containing protein [Ruminococcus sp.]